MRKTLRKVIRVLDGQPTGMKGQSLVEMALTFPILILMILSLTEVGFLANNYLILMDIVRSAGRAAVNLDVSKWVDQDTRNFNRMDCDSPATGNTHFNDYHRLGNNPVSGNPDPLLEDDRRDGFPI